MNLEEAIKQKKFQSAQQKAWININYTFNYLSDHISKVFGQFDITQQQYNVLRILRGRHPESACCNEVKEVMLDKNPDLTRLCDRLVSKGLIARDLNSTNRRQVSLHITEEGLKLLTEIEPVMKEYSVILNNLSDEEAQTLSNLLDKLRG
ncbi:MAG TPA: MarR family transcriptional regulator [Cytophagales bacterium]|nr:MarR family transcriptional regulator [Cytophagales bacterium]